MPQRSKAVIPLNLRIFLSLGSLLILAACSVSFGPSPLKNLQRSLAGAKEYSIILEDMKLEGNFSKDYYHQYKVVALNKITGKEETEFKDYVTDFMMVDEETYKTYENALGMVVASKDENGKETNVAQPPGYQYVGNSQYGTWRTSSNGSSFWEFYGKYAFMSSMFNLFSGPVYRNDWDGYRRNYGSGRPYYGSKNQSGVSRWGTRGTNTQTTHKNFFARQKARQASKNKGFANKVKSRVNGASSTRTGRSSMSSTRSRSSRGGK